MIKYIRPEDTLSLRSRVLRNNMPLEQCIFPTDNLGFHLGAVINEKIVCIASFFPEDCPDWGAGGYKLRGMASDPDFAGMGCGRELIKFAKNELIAANASYIWCNARSSAVDFYKKSGFEVISDEFEVPGIGMHFNMLYNLNKMMNTIDQCNFENKKALVRVDFNVPLDKEFNITDDKRMRAALPTITKILNDGGSVILMSHLGRPKGGPEDKYSLKHILGDLSRMLDLEVKFANDCIGQDAKDKALNLVPGQVLLLENLRFYKEEEAGDKEFAGKLARLGDVYVNDAFGTAHRAHASTAIVAEFFPDAKYFGYLMAEELKNAEKINHHAVKPFTAIMGGAKVSDKILLIESLLEKVDNLIIGGGMAYTFAKAQGGEIGSSLLEADRMPLCLELLEKAKAKGVNIYLPLDTVVADKFDNDADKKNVNTGEIPEDWMGLDIGPKTIELFSKVIKNSKTLLWNGPMGVFEMENFAHGTRAIADAVVAATQENDAFSLIGGGDSAAAIAKFNLENEVSYVSTGGGALLEYMEGKELPGVKAINS
jgi:phosphoglycerate kinase